jgi:hypothetical protein
MDETSLDSPLFQVIKDMQTPVRLVDGRPVYPPAHEFKEQVNAVEKIAQIYNICFQQLLAEGHTDLNKFMLYDSANVMRDMKSFVPSKAFFTKAERTIYSIDLALSGIGKDEGLILYNEFFFPAGQKWWIKYFSRSTYYRCKRTAVSAFLREIRVWDVN